MSRERPFQFLLSLILIFPRQHVLLCGEEEGGVDGPTSDPVSASAGPTVHLVSFSSGSGVISLLFLLKLPLAVSTL